MHWIFPERRCKRAALIAELALPVPFNIRRWRDNLAARRGRPIEFIPLSSAQLLALTGDSGVHALVIAFEDLDLIVYKADLPKFMVVHNIIHELVHLAKDHPTPQLAGAWDLARLREICLCSASTSPDPARRAIEEEAERLALAVEDYRGEPPPAALSPDGATAVLFGRVAEFFGDWRTR